MLAPTNGVEATHTIGSGIRNDAVRTSGRSETQRPPLSCHVPGYADGQRSTTTRTARSICRIARSGAASPLPIPVQDLEEQSEDFVSQDTVNVNLTRKNLVPGTVTVTNAQGSVVAPANYILNMTRGAIRGTAPGHSRRANTQ